MLARCVIRGMDVIGAAGRVAGRPVRFGPPGPAGRVLVVVGGEGMRVGAVVPVRVDMDRDILQPPEPMQELVADCLGELVRPVDGQVPVDSEVELGVQLVTDPPNAGRRAPRCYEWI